MKVSFDFDNCLFNEENHVFIEETLTLLRWHLANGDDVIVCTSRIQKWADEAKLLLTCVGVDVPVFSAPDRIGDGGITKSDILVKEGVSKHFDDIVDADELIFAKESGVVILLPPHLM